MVSPKEKKKENRKMNNVLLERQSNKQINNFLWNSKSQSSYKSLDKHIKVLNSWDSFIFSLQSFKTGQISLKKQYLKEKIITNRYP